MTHYWVQKYVQKDMHVTELLPKSTKNYVYKSEAEFELLIEYTKLLCRNGRLNQLKMWEQMS